MADEICIPTDRVPPEILEKLKQIGLLLQSQPGHSPSSPSPLSSMKTEDDLGADDVDGFQPTHSSMSSVVSVLPSEVRSHESVSVTQHDGDIVSVFAHRPSLAEERQTCSVQSFRQVHSDVISVLSAGLGQSSSPHQPQATPTPQKSPALSQSSQQYVTSAHSDVSYRSPPSPQHQASPFRSQDSTEELRRQNSRSPPRTPVKHCRSPSNPESSAPSSSPQTFGTRSSPSRSVSEDDVLRVFPSRSVTPSVDPGPQGLKMLTPPETPKRAVPEIFTFDEATCAQFRQKFPEQSQLTPPKRAPSTPRKLSATPGPPPPPTGDPAPLLPPARRPSPVDQRLLHCFEAASSVPPPPPAPKKKGPDVPKSPSSAMQLISLHENPSPYPSASSERRDTVSPQPPKKRLDFEEERVSPQVLQSQMRMGYDPSTQPYPRGSENPFTFKQIDGQQYGGSENLFTFKASQIDGQQYSASENLFTFKSSPIDNQQYGGSENPFTFKASHLDGQQYCGNSRAGASKAALERELRQRMEFLATYQEQAEEDEDDGNERTTLYASAAYASAAYETTFDFQGRMASQGKPFGKRRRQDPEPDGSDNMLLCTCAAMERNFLLMAEEAYTRVRRRDNSPEDFERFRTELAQTNNILRESMALMKHIRDICDHRKRPRW